MENSNIRKTVLCNFDLDIICISETHLKDNVTNQPNLKNYHWFGHCRKLQNIRAPRAFGGVGIFVKNELFRHYDISPIDNCYDGILGLLFVNRISDAQFIVFSCYLPPEESVWGRDCDSFFSHLLVQVYLYSNVEEFFICGDFNSRIGDLSDCISEVDNLPNRVVIDATKNGHGAAFVDFLHESKMCICNGRISSELCNFTSISPKGRAVVDYIAVKHEGVTNCIKCEVLTPIQVVDIASATGGISERAKPPDHSLIILEYDMLHEYIQSTTESDASQGQKRRYNFNDISNNFLNSEHCQTVLRNVIAKLESTVLAQDELDRVYDNVCSELFKEFDNCLEYRDCSTRTRKKFKHFKPFWNEELTDKWKNMKDAEKVFTKMKQKSEHGLRFAKDNFLRARSEFDRLLRQTERQYYRNEALELERINVNDPKKFWDTIKRLGPGSKKRIPDTVYTRNGTLTAEKTVVLETWEKEFHRLFNPLDSGRNLFDEQFYEQKLQEKDIFEERMNVHDYSGNPDLNRDITVDEIDKVLNNLKNKKAVGPDQVPNEVLKTKKLNLFLFSLFCKCFNFNMIPSMWQKAIIVPIPKSSLKDPHVPLNYRGISLLSCIYKIYTNLINNRLVKYCENSCSIVDEQNGFRSGRSCTDHLFALTSIVKNRINQNMSTFAAFVDFKKAFDFVDRRLLLYKLYKNFGIDGKMYNTLKCLNAHSISCVRINDMTTNWFGVNSGVRQGDSLSPLLFSLFINDLILELNKLKCGVNISENVDVTSLLYADDLVIIAPSEEKLQCCLQYVNTWCNRWRMVVNEEKTEIVHFRKKSAGKTQYQFKYGNSILNVNSKYRYLGLVLDEYLNFNTTSDVLAEAGGRALGGIKCKVKYIKDCGYSTYMKLYDTGVIPILNYAAGIWGYGNYAQHDYVQRRALRYFLGVHRFAPNHAIEGDMGVYPTKISRHIEMIRLWNRLVTMNPNRLTTRIFEWDKAVCNRNWSEEVYSILEKVGMDDLFFSKSLVDTNCVQCKLQQLEQKQWEENRFTKMKLRYYNMFKNCIEPECYVAANSSKVKRSVLAQFRAGILPLAIETGRFRNLDVEQRVCLICPSEIEDEFHFLMSCPNYAELRINMFTKILSEYDYFNDMEDIEKFIFLNSNCQLEVGKFLVAAWEKRKMTLFR